MAKRRANGEGSITRKGKYWRGRLSNGRGVNGKQEIVYFHGKTQNEALAKMEAFKEARRNGICLDSGKCLLGDWLDEWYKVYSFDKVKLSTQVNDESIINNHLKPHLGHIKLCNLEYHQIQKVYDGMLISGRADKKGGLSAKTIRNIHIVLHRTLEQAVKNGLIAKNPLNCVSLPKNIKKEIEILLPDEAKRLSAICFESLNPKDIAVLLTLFSGLRMGEVLALSWDDVDLEKGIIRVEKQVSRLKDYSADAKAKTKLHIRNEVKSKSSKRFVSILKRVLDKMIYYKAEQDKIALRLGESFNKENLVFYGDNGGIIDPSTFRSHYLSLLKKAEIKSKKFHALRHTFATIALRNGVALKVVTEILGHSNIQITADTYMHVDVDMQREAMNRIEDKFFAKEVV